MKEVYKLTGHKNFVISVTVSKDGHYALSSSYDKTVILWDLWSGKELRRFNKPATSLSFSPIDDLVLSGSSDKIVRLWNIENGEDIHQFQVHNYPISDVLFSPDGKIALTGGHGVVFLWDTINGKELSNFTVYKHASLKLSMAFSPDGNQAIFGDQDNTIYLWDIENIRLMRQFKGSKNAYQRKYGSSAFSTILALAFSLDGQFVISGGMDHLIRYWDLEKNRESRCLSMHKGWVNSLAISPNGQKMLSGSSDKTVLLIDIESGKEIECFTGHTDFVSSVVFTPDGSHALSASWDSTIRLWKLPK